jgi:hypothetical protein
MKIFDCFLFSKELDILEIRLNELDQYVDKFILCESKFSFAGKPKPLIFEENKNRFTKFLNKIVHLVIEDPLENYSAENREYYNRNYLLSGIPNNIEEEDIIIFSDVDEIPKIQNLPSNFDVCVFRQDMYYFNFNSKFISPNDHANWHGSIAFKAKYKNQINLQNLRFQRYNIPQIVGDGGWHFSYFGSVDDIIQKIINGGHTEMHNLNINEEIIYNRIKNQQDVLGRDNYVLKNVNNNIDLPAFVLYNKTKYNTYFNE